VKVMALYIGVNHDGVAWASSWEFSQAMRAGAVLLQRFPLFGGGNSQIEVCWCLLTSLWAFANRLSRWTAGQRRNRSP
jgi:hypothetical protein